MSTKSPEYIAPKALAALRKEMEVYSPISDETWRAFAAFCTLLHLPSKTLFTPPGELPMAFGFVYSGLLRAYITDNDGNEYNKIFFRERTFPGSMVAMLTQSPSQFAIETLEESWLVRIDFQKYRDFLFRNEQIKCFHILYLEKNWLVAKEEREVAFVQQNATQRYLNFKEEYGELENRLPQYHIASHLGVTPTQLSRIRSQLRAYKKA